MKKYQYIFFSIILLTLSVQCKNQIDTKGSDSTKIHTLKINLITTYPNVIDLPTEMIWVPGRKYIQGALAIDMLAMINEKPAHRVAVDGFFMDIHEVTNKQFKEFVEATGYITIAERKIIWNELKEQVSPETPKPPDSLLQPGSLIFKKTTSQPLNLFDYSQWWEWKIGASWKHPNGLESTIERKDNYPVVHIAFEDAIAYCQWANRRLPTEAEWELASRGKNMKTIFNWGNSDSKLSEKANTWEGNFPSVNIAEDGYERIAPVKSFPPNSIGLYDMAGNIWEWTQDWYDPNYYRQLKHKRLIHNPKGATKPYNSNNPKAQEKVIKGGSFLCNKTYCASYRNSARMPMDYESSSEHVGFRTVVTVEMLNALDLNNN